jgi:hypothetical protein
MRPLDQALRLRIRGSADDHLRAEGAAEGLSVAGQLAAPAAPPAHRALAVPHHRRGTAPSFSRCCHHPTNRSPARRDGISTADSQREEPHTIVSTRQLGRSTGLAAEAATFTLSTSSSPCRLGSPSWGFPRQAQHQDAMERTVGGRPGRLGREIAR